MSTLKHFLLFMAIAALLTCCSKDDSLDVGDNTFVPIELSPATKGFVENGNAFAYKLLAKVAEKEEANFTISPLSLSLAMGMLIEGADEGEVLDSVCDILGYEGGSREDIRKYCSTMIDRLPGMDKLSKVATGNLVMTNNNYGKTNPSFEKSVTNYYDAMVKNMSFTNKKDVMGFVNDWAYKRTNKLIKEVINDSDFQPSTSAILANAFCFSGKWTSGFEKKYTSKEDFVMENDEKIRLDMMKQKGHFYQGRIYSSDVTAARVLQLPYGNEAFVLNVFLPHGENGVKETLDLLAAGNKPKDVNNYIETEVWFPKFRSSGRVDLRETLREMGLARAFVQPWLSLHEGGSKSYVEKVFQATSFEVNESGTEAAATTIVSMMYGSAGKEISPTLFHVDRPFIYTITESSTGAVLFAGVFRG